VPSEIEKKACPKASNTTLGVIFEKSGKKRNFSPSHAPGREHATAISPTSIRKSRGIITFDAFSMPPRTPFTTIECVITMNVSAISGDAIAPPCNASNFCVAISLVPNTIPS